MILRARLHYIYTITHTFSTYFSYVSGVRWDPVTPFGGSGGGMRGGGGRLLIERLHGYVIHEHKYSYTLAHYSYISRYIDSCFAVNQILIRQ